MKLALLFLSVFVAASYQHFERPRRMLWWPANLPMHALNYYQPFNYGGIEDSGPSFRYFQSERPVPYSKGAEDSSLLEQEYDESGNVNVQSRVNGYRPFQNSQSSKQQNGRFFFNSGLNNNNNNIGNPLLKTVTFSITSTCTAVTFTTCIPAPAGIAAAAKPCRRKRQIDHTEDDFGSQFPVNPTKVQLLMPTELSSPTLQHSYHRIATDIASSKENDAVNESNDFLEQIGNQSRKKRLYYLWQSFATGTTITTWVIVSTTSTYTLVPLDAAGAALAPLACLPPGYFICPAKV